jgi:PhoH-like ATPase
MEEKNTREINVIDTNVILHNVNAMYSFHEKHVVVPSVVIPEIDRFKRDDGFKGENAREFSRKLLALTAEEIFNGGVSLGGGLGKISVKLLPETAPEIVTRNFPEPEVDNKILILTYSLAEEHGFDKVCLVSQDLNLRIKAKAIGLHAVEFDADSVPIKEVKNPYMGFREINNVPDTLVDKLHRNKEMSASLILEGQKDLSEKDFFPNEFFFFNKGGEGGDGSKKKTGLAIYRRENDQEKGVFQVVQKSRGPGLLKIIPAKNAEQSFGLWAMLDPSIKIVTMEGKAGSGKTFISLLAGLQQMHNISGSTSDKFEHIVVTRAIVPVGRDLGYLPGDIDQKVGPYMKGVSDNFNSIKKLMSSRKNEKEAKKIQECQEKLILEPVASIRGRNLADMYLIIDEAQNLTPSEIKTILTRAGHNTKVILIGDPEQIDNPYLNRRNNGLTYAISRLKGDSIHSHVALVRCERSLLADRAAKLL